MYLAKRPLMILMLFMLVIWTMATGRWPTLSPLREGRSHAALEKFGNILVVLNRFVWETGADIPQKNLMLLFSLTDEPVVAQTFAINLPEQSRSV